MMKRGPKPKGRVDLNWRPELAYAIGLLTADGSLSNNGRHIDFTSADLENITNFQTCLGLLDIHVGTKRSTHNSSILYYRIQFGDVLFYRWLVDIGLSSNKSLTVGSLQIPDEYFFDFLRGEWDGDGTIYCSQDKRWRSSYIVSLGFASGSRTFLSWLQVEINKRLQTTGYISQNERVLQLRYARKDSKKIFDNMFYKTDLPHLPRKLAKARKIFTMTGLAE
jgi:intein/homing endonuclease